MKRVLFALAALVLLSAVGLAQPGTATGTSTSTTTTEKSTKTAVFRPTKAQIEQVQTLLKEKKLYSGEASGKYNDDTRAGIRSLQKEMGVRETGTLNRVTLEKFGIELTEAQKKIPAAADVAKPESSKADKAPAAGDSPKKPAPFRANAEQIGSAQKMMKDGKMYTGDATGKLDKDTRDSLKKYQETNGLKVTGTLNAATLEKMGIALTDAQKANVAAQTAYDAAKSKN